MRAARLGQRRVSVYVLFFAVAQISFLVLNWMYQFPSQPAAPRLTRLPRNAVSWTCPIVTFELHAVQTPLAGPYKTEGLNF